jgi:hypothetical protein
MPEESGVGTVAEWSVPSSGIKKEVSVKTFFGVFLSSFSCNYFEYCFWLLFFSSFVAYLYARCMPGILFLYYKVITCVFEIHSPCFGGKTKIALAICGLETITIWDLHPT